MILKLEDTMVQKKVFVVIACFGFFLTPRGGVGLGQNKVFNPTKQKLLSIE